MLFSLLLRFSLFLNFSALIYLGTILYFGSYKPHLTKNIQYRLGGTGHSFTRFQEAKIYRAVNTLIIGSSHAYRGIDPRILESYGISSFNLGTSAQTPRQSELILRRYVDIFKPKSVILDVYPPLFCRKGVESTLDIVSNDTNDIQSFELVLNERNALTFNTFVLSSFYQYFGIKNEFKENRHKAKDSYITGGFVESNSEKRVNDRIDSFEIEILDSQLSAIESIKRICEERGIRLIMTFAPVTKKKYESFRNIETFESVVKNFEYYDFNTIIALEDSIDFMDSHHLNQSGVHKYNRMLVETIFVDS